jgi:hypothetical protein
MTSLLVVIMFPGDPAQVAAGSAFFVLTALVVFETCIFFRICNFHCILSMHIITSLIVFKLETHNTMSALLMVTHSKISQLESLLQTAC